MKRLPVGIGSLGLLLLSSGCFVSAGEPEEHSVNILAISPQGPAQKTGLRQKFGVMLRDSGNAKKLNVYARVDQEDWIECEFDLNPTNTIDRTVNETIFWCPVKTAGIRAGQHGVTFVIEDGSGEELTRQSASFVHDPEPPALQADIQRSEKQARLTWSVADGRDFRELTLQKNGVRIFSSYGSSGEAILEESLVRPGTVVEVRAYDTLANVVVQTLTVP